MAKKNDKKELEELDKKIKEADLKNKEADLKLKSLDEQIKDKENKTKIPFWIVGTLIAFFGMLAVYYGIIKKEKPSDSTIIIDQSRTKAAKDIEAEIKVPTNSGTIKQTDAESKDGNIKATIGK